MTISVSAAPRPWRSSRKSCRRWVRPVLCAVALLLPLPAEAFRPFDGTDASIAPPHLFELELSPMSYVRVGDERALLCPGVTFNYGTGAAWEFVLEGQRVMPLDGSDSPRFRDLEFSTKTVLRKGVLQGGKGPSIATEEGIRVPSRGERGAGFSASVVVSHEVSQAMLHVNFELSRTRDQEFGRFISAIAEGPESWPVRPVAEVTWERAGDATAERGILGGVIWQTRAGMALDLGLRTARSDEHSIEVRSGFTWKLQVHQGD